MGADRVAFEVIDARGRDWGTALNLYLTGGCDWLDGSVPPCAEAAAARTSAEESPTSASTSTG
jgi:hypothetical protein